MDLSTALTGRTKQIVIQAKTLVRICKVWISKKIKRYWTEESSALAHCLLHSAILKSTWYLRLNKASSLNEIMYIETNLAVINVEGTKAKSYYNLMLEKKKKEKVGFHFWKNILGLPKTFVWKDVFQ